jgi:hypothetical protein
MLSRTKGGPTAMPKFLIEVPHEAERMACIRAVETFLNSGSHFIANADWGCHDGDHRAWVVVDVASKDEARAIVPPIFRSQAKIVALNSFTLRDLQSMVQEHKGS